MLSPVVGRASSRPTTETLRPWPARDSRATEAETLRRQAHTDAASGLPNRRHFIGRLRTTLAEAAGAGLLIARLAGEHDDGALAADGLPAAADLSALAELLSGYPQHVPGAFCGRLNETDFGLCLPTVGQAEATASTLLRALQTLRARGVRAALAIGGVDGLYHDSASSALAAADQALALAEAAGPDSLHVQRAAESDEPALGERAWRARIDDALSAGRASLAAFPVLARDGSLIHLECPLRMQLEPGGALREARCWLAMASRARLLPRVDLAALDCALAAIADDGKPRCVHVSTASLLSSGFVGEVAHRLESSTKAATRLWLEVADGSALARVLPRLREAGAAWRRHGVRLGVEHAGASMTSLARLSGIGLDHVKVEARFVRGVATEPAVRAFAGGLVALAHGIGLQAIAEGVDGADDLATLWSLGFDGATGPALTAG